MYPTYESIRRDLLNLEALIDSFLLLDSKLYFRSILATYVANRYKDCTVWILLVGTPSNGKTVLANFLGGQIDCHFVDSLTPAALLPGSSSADDPGRPGGLLFRIGDCGILVIRDFTVILDMPHSQRIQVFSFFRDVYDGELCRAFGSNGGMQRVWSGKIGMIGCVTPAIDRCHLVNATMGDRTLFIRMRGNNRLSYRQALLAMQRSKTGITQAEIKEETSSFLKAVNTPWDTPVPQLPEEVLKMIAALATVVSVCRSAVDRDSSGEVGSLPQVEGPSRIGLQLRALYQGHLDIGLLPQEAWDGVTHIAWSSMPPMRCSVFRMVLAHPEIKVYEVAEKLRLKNASTRRTLLELTALGALSVHSKKSADLYIVSEELQGYCRMAEIHPEAQEVPHIHSPESFPEKSQISYRPVALVSDSVPRVAIDSTSSAEIPPIASPIESVADQSATSWKADFPEKSHVPYPQEGNSTEQPTIEPLKRVRRASSFSTEGHVYPEPDHSNSKPLKAGMVFGSWTALQDDPHKHRGKVLCHCVCGKERRVRLDSLYSGRSKSCGCAPYSHREQKTPKQPKIVSCILNHADEIPATESPDTYQEQAVVACSV